MALIKGIELDNGVTVNYHRIVSVNSITNKKSIIEIASYTSKSKRKEEKDAIESGKSMNVFISPNFIATEFNKELNVDSAYEYLKTIPQFSGCTDD